MVINNVLSSAGAGFSAFAGVRDAHIVNNSCYLLVDKAERPPTFVPLSAAHANSERHPRAGNDL